MATLYQIKFKLIKLHYLLIQQFSFNYLMYASSNKRFNIDTSKPSSNYVTVNNPVHQGITNSYSPKNNSKPDESLFKSNFMSRYSSQENLQSYASPKFLLDQTNNSPKSHQDSMFKKFNFPIRKSNNLTDKQFKNFRQGQLKHKSSIITGQTNFSYFKSAAFEEKGVKQLKQTSSTNNTQNIIQGARSEKSIPSFLKNGGQNRRKILESQCLKKQIHLSQNTQHHYFSIDDFQIVQKLGQGKFGIVFLAMEKQSGFMVAIKAVQKKRVIEQNFLTQFIRQLKIQAYLQHPHLAKVYGFFHDQNYFYSILELGEGGQLYDIIKNGQTLTEEATSFIIGNLLDAISYMHEKKILHRDIKPENIVLVHGTVKLCDFGWAVYKKAQLRSTFCGTPLYLSPELLTGQKYDEKVDLWAIGILAFQLHLGSSPFNIQSQQDLLKIITSEIEYPQDCHVSKNFKQFIGAVLKKDPKERLQAKKLMQMKLIKSYKELQTCVQLCQ